MDKLMVPLILCLALPVAAVTPDAMPANSWLAVPNTHMLDVAPAYDEFPGTWGTVGPNGVIIAWGGGAYDTVRDQLVLWGGGHADYYGNELYAFHVPTLTWRRLTDPTIRPVMDQEVNADGTPNSRHTYNGLAYLTHVDRFFGQAGSLAGIGFARCDRTWTFDLTSLTWTDEQPQTSPGGGFGCVSAYDAATGKLWWGACNNSSSGLWSYDVDANTWTKHNNDYFYDQTGAIDPGRGILLVAGLGELFAYDLRAAQLTRQDLSAGAPSFIDDGSPGLDFDPVADRFVAWAGGPVQVFDSDTLTWTGYSAAGAPTPTRNGIYGRWRYVPSVNAFIVVTDGNEDVHFYKLTEGGVLPSDPAPGAPQSLRVL